MPSETNHEENKGSSGWPTLWLPLEARGPAWIATAFVSVVYLLTMSRDLSFFDSGELATVAIQGGLSHPPGHPLYTILGWLVTRLPGIPPLLLMNALSAIPAALCVIPAISLAESLLGARGKPDTTRWLRRRYLLPAVVAGFALHPALWTTASRVEVYALASFFALWAVAHIAANISKQETRFRGWMLSGIALGLSASVNPVVATAAALSTTPGLIFALLRRQISWTRGLVLVGSGLLGLLPYAYVPLVASRQDVFVWGAPTQGEALRRFLTGADFVDKKVELTGALMWQHVQEWLTWTVDVGLTPLLGLGLIAFMLLGKHLSLGRFCIFINLGLVVLFLSTNIIFLPEVPDFIGYQAVALWLLSSGVAALLAKFGGDEENPRREVLAGLLVVALGAHVAITPPSIFGRTRHRDRVARMLAESALESAPRDAIVIVASDHWVFPLMYLQEIEGLRPDVAVLPRGLSGASWAWAHLYRRHRDLAEFPLRGPGGQPARIDRFLEANAERPVLYESWNQAASIGRRPGCIGPWLLRDENACENGEVASPDVMTSAVDRSIRWVGPGSPMTAAVLARVSFDRGEMHWRLGQPAEALHALRAGVPADLRPPRPSLRDPSGVAPLSALLPRWRSGPIVGHHGQNLYLAARLLFIAGAGSDGAAHLVAAERTGIYEAVAFARTLRESDPRR